MSLEEEAGALRVRDNERDEIFCAQVGEMGECFVSHFGKMERAVQLEQGRRSAWMGGQSHHPREREVGGERAVKMVTRGGGTRER